MSFVTAGRFLSVRVGLCDPSAVATGGRQESVPVLPRLPLRSAFSEQGWN